MNSVEARLSKKATVSQQGELDGQRVRLTIRKYFNYLNDNLMND